MKQISIILMILIISPVFAQDQYVLHHHKEIKKLFKEKKYYDAIYALNENLENYPDNGPTYYNRGLAKWLLGDVIDAKGDFIAAWEKDFEWSNEYIDAILDKAKMAKLLAENYLDQTYLDPDNDYRPNYTLKDTLQGALRHERTCFDVYFYDLTVRVITEEKKIEGKNFIYFKVTDTTSRIQIDLFENYTIHSIQMGNEQLAYERIHNAVFIELKNTLEVGEKHSIQIDYSGIPREAPKPPWNGGFIWKKNRGKDWVGVACEHLGASSWWPNKDHLSDKTDSMVINIQAPNDVVAISNGNLRNTKVLDDKFTNYEWFVSYPINNYNVTFYLGDFIEIKEKYTNKNSTYDIDYYVLPKSRKKAEKYYKQTKDVVRVFEALFGEYPFKNDGMAFVEAPYAGMEHQSAIAIGDDYKCKGRRLYENNEYDYLVVHEAAHEWWGNTVAIGDMADAWINEGFATYAEHLFMEQIYGYQEYINASATNMMIIFNLWPIVGTPDVNDNTFLGGDIYHKGAAMLNNLRCIINNDSLFFAIIKGFYNTYKFRICDTKDFVNFVHDKTGRDYSDFFNKFLYDEEPPVLEYNFSIVNKTLSLKYRWLNVGKNFEMPFSLTINSDTNIRLLGTTKLQAYRHEDVESIYLDNAYHYDKDLINPNSFTYYWTAWIEEIPAEIVNKDLSYGVGNLAAKVKQGRWIYYYPNNRKKRVATYLDGDYHGQVWKFSTEGHLSSLCNYYDGELHGPCTYYRSNGTKESEGEYKDGKKTGIWYLYNDDEVSFASGKFNDGNCISETWKYFNVDGKEIKTPDTMQFVESPPCFPGGEKALAKFIEDNIETPENLTYEVESGKIFISFYVNPNGTLTDLKPVQTFSDEWADSLIDVFLKMPSWKPGLHNGNPVVVKYYFPYTVSYKPKSMR